MSEHTKLPLSVRARPDLGAVDILDADDFIIAYIDHGREPCDRQDTERAAFIVRACNNLERLRYACLAALHAIEGYGLGDICDEVVERALRTELQAALKAAEEEA